MKHRPAGVHKRPAGGGDANAGGGGGGGPPAAKSRRLGSASVGGGGGGGGGGSGLRQVGQWKPEDDQLLLQGVLALLDLRAVHCCVRFSCAFTESELRERWRSLLYDRTVSGLAEQAARALPAPIRFATRRRAPFSHAEEELLEAVSPAQAAPDGRVSLECFERLLARRPDVFAAACRTAKSLHRHWELLRRHGLLRACPPLAWPVGATATDFQDAEFLVERFRSAGPGPPGLQRELDWEARRARCRLARLEEEARRWQAAARDALPQGARPPEPAGDHFVSSDGRPALALLKGARASFLISGVRVSLGRRTPGCAVDIDLGLEGASGKVSRLHAYLRLLESGAFQLETVGRRPVFVNGEPVATGEACLLASPSVLLVGCLAFRFLVNPELRTGRFRRAIAEALRVRRE